jgi:hypothetical protein
MERLILGCRTNASWKVDYVTDVAVPTSGNITNPYGWLVCAGGEPLSGVSMVRR